MKGGGPVEDLQTLKETKYPYEKIVRYPPNFDTSTPDEKKKSLEEMLKQSKMMKKNLRKHYVDNNKLPHVPVKRGKSKKPGSPEHLRDYTKKDIEDELSRIFEKIEEDKYIREDSMQFDFKQHFTFDKEAFKIELEKYFPNDNRLTITNTTVDQINNELNNLQQMYLELTNGDEIDKELYDNFVEDANAAYTTIINRIHEYYNKLPADMAGGAPTKYKSTGQVVYIVYKNKKYKRTIYTKEKGKTKYCKMNNEYILLSKCKIIV
jgi:hypothetical protein